MHSQSPPKTDGLRVNWPRYLQSPINMTQELIHLPAHFAALAAGGSGVGSTNIIGMSRWQRNPSADRSLRGNPSAGQIAILH